MTRKKQVGQTGAEAKGVEKTGGIRTLQASSPPNSNVIESLRLNTNDNNRLHFASSASCKRVEPEDDLPRQERLVSLTVDLSGCTCSVRVT